MRSVAIEGTSREELGTKSAKQLRRQGMVPCVIYGAGRNIHFYTDHRSFKDILYTPEAMMAVVNIDGNEIKCIVRDAQYHPVSEELEHVDLLELAPGKAVQIKVPINLVGNARGVRNGGKLKFILRKVSIRATEENLPGMIDLDIENLRIGQTLRVGDLPADNFEVTDNPSLTVVAIRTARGAVEDTDDEEGEGEAEEAKEEAEA